MKLKKTKKINKPFILAFSLLGAVLLVVIILRLLPTEDTSTAPRTDGNGISYAPPTKEEQLSGDRQKEIITNKQDSVNNNVDKANITMSAGVYNGIVEIRSFISNVYEEGVCEVTVSKENIRITERKVEATPDATTTLCRPIDIPVSDLPEKGEYVVTVTYNAGSSGASGSTSTSLVVR